jgi:hypothetical protein
MRRSLGIAIGGLVGVAALVLRKFARSAPATSGDDSVSARNADELLHTERTFEFLAKAPMDVVAQLFGADKERLWAPGWEPDFLWPAKASDREGMVFTVAHGRKKTIWVNTGFDLEDGRVQYVYVIPDAVVTVIAVGMVPDGERTHVVVEYDRTALKPAANDLVRQLAENDGKAGPEWEKQIDDYLRSSPNG